MSGAGAPTLTVDGTGLRVVVVAASWHQVVMGGLLDGARRALADAHVAAARALADGGALEPVYNLGSGDGLSVREIMTAVARVTGIDFEPEITARRPGDPARIVASGELAARDLGWQMRHSIDDMVRSAWDARSAH